MNAASIFGADSSHPAAISMLPTTASATAAGNTTSTSSSSSDASSTADAANDTLTNSDFMDLLVSQLQNQDPTSPMDPTTFVSQLIQFNSLENLVSINAELAPPATSDTSGSSSSSSGSDSSSGSSIPGATGSAAAASTGTSSGVLPEFVSNALSTAATIF